MKKFTLMILAVSTFFVALGGVAERAVSELKFGERFQTSIDRLNLLNEDEAFGDVKKFTIIRKVNPDFDLSDSKKGVSEENFKIDLPAGAGEHFRKTFRFERHLNKASLPKDGQLPRIPKRNLIIVKTDGGETLKISEAEKIEVSEVKVSAQQEAETK